MTPRDEISISSCPAFYQTVGRRCCSVERDKDLFIGGISDISSHSEKKSNITVISCS